MDQIQRTEHNETNGYITSTQIISVYNDDDDEDPGDPFLSTRPQGQSKRKWTNRGDDFYFFNCSCGKSTGNMYCKKRYKLWLRLHKKKCSLYK